MDVTTRPAEADPDNWCDWCADLIAATPIHYDGRRFCTLKCVADYRAAPPRAESEQP